MMRERGSLFAVAFVVAVVFVATFTNAAAAAAATSKKKGMSRDCHVPGQFTDRTIISSSTTKPLETMRRLLPVGTSLFEEAKSQDGK